jgi:hypothetical protein
MTLSPSWEATKCVATQEFPSILWNPKVHYRVHESTPQVPVWARPIQSIPCHPNSIKSIFYCSPAYVLRLKYKYILLIIYDSYAVNATIFNGKYYSTSLHVLNLYKSWNIRNKMRSMNVKIWHWTGDLIVCGRIRTIIRMDLKVDACECMDNSSKTPRMNMVMTFQIEGKEWIEPIHNIIRA